MKLNMHHITYCRNDGLYAVRIVMPKQGSLSGRKGLFVAESDEIHAFGHVHA